MRVRGKGRVRVRARVGVGDRVGVRVGVRDRVRVRGLENRAVHLRRSRPAHKAEAASTPAPASR